MGVKLKVNIPVQSITADSLPAEVELDEKGIGGALALLIQQQTGIDDATAANLMTDHDGNVYISRSDKQLEEKIVSNDLTKVALVDAMNALIFGKPKKIGQAKPD